MPINPRKIAQLKDRYQLFQTEHPKVMPFLSAVGNNAIDVGSVLEMKVADPNGREYKCNIRLTQDDLETYQMLRELKK